MKTIKIFSALVITVLAVFAVVSPQPAMALSCVFNEDDPLTPQEHFDRAQYVFTGEVIRAQRGSGSSAQEYTNNQHTIEVSGWLKSDLTDQFITVTSDPTWGPFYEVGRDAIWLYNDISDSEMVPDTSVVFNDPLCVREPSSVAKTDNFYDEYRNIADSSEVTDPDSSNNDLENRSNRLLILVAFVFVAALLSIVVSLAVKKNKKSAAKS